jgi:TP901 family phage tail tape measure protein
MAAGFKLIGAAAQQAAIAVKTAALGMLPFAFAAYKGTKAAVDFEQQMSGVQSILQRTKAEMEPLADEARRMGIVSVFSATQSAKAMEYMARAGFSTSEIIGGLEGVMNAAAAEGMELATAADIVASNVRAFGLRASDASKVADILALTSSKTNTNIQSLAEGLKYVAPIARGLGVDLAETSATLGLLADSGIRGTLAGTAMKNALLKLAAPTGRGQAAFKRLGLTVKDSSGNFIGMEAVLKQLSTGMNNIGGNIDRTKVAAHLFGLRGVALTNLLDRLEKKAGSGAITFSEFNKMLHNATGTAKKMADVRLDNLAGRITLLKSSLESLGILTFQPMMEPMADSIKGFTDGLNNVLTTVTDFRRAMSAGFSEAETLQELNARFGETTVSMAMGIIDAVKTMKDGWKSLINGIKAVGKSIEDTFGKGGLRKLVKFLITAGSAATVILPILVVLKLLSMLVMGTVVPAIKLLGIAFKLAMGPVGWIIMGVIALFMLMRKENESLLGTIKRVWGAIKSVLSVLWNFIDGTIMNFFRGFAESLGGIFTAIKQVFATIWSVVETVFGWIWEDSSNTTDAMSKNFRDFGRLVGCVILSALKGFATLFQALDDWIKDSRVNFQQWMHNTEAQAYKNAFAIGLIDKKQYDRKMARLKTVNKMIDADRNKRRNYVAERERELKKLQQLNEKTTESKTRAAKPRAMNVDVKLPPMEDKRTLEIKNTMCVDGQAVSTAISKHQVEVMERSGAKTTQWQRRAAVEFGAIPAATQGYPTG